MLYCVSHRVWGAMTLRLLIAFVSFPCVFDVAAVSAAKRICLADALAGVSFPCLPRADAVVPLLPCRSTTPGSARALAARSVPPTPSVPAAPRQASRGQCLDD